MFFSVLQNFIIIFNTPHSQSLPKFLGLDHAINGRFYTTTLLTGVDDGESNKTTDTEIKAASAQKLSGTILSITQSFRFTLLIYLLTRDNLTRYIIRTSLYE